ncbi:MAG: tetratricopeptide repeat protein [Acidobacteriia bacterium]|nr:tetratricopeptide repeat protein [Terriglobia bacterium]
MSHPGGSPSRSPAAEPAERDASRTAGSRNGLIALALAAATLLVYARAVGFDFVGLDDAAYASRNPFVLGGPTRTGIAWAFTTTYQANWHPLTWISLMIDAALGGKAPWLFHLTNVVLHLANTLLLFHVLFRMTGLPWRSAFVAALFAVHPLHVESVAWITERKDVLSTLFWLLAMLAYLRHVERPTRPRYLLVPAAMALGLLAKPMLVTLPLVLLLLDVWPLRRFPSAAGPGDSRGRTYRLVLEKAPLFALSLVSSVVTIYAQKKGGAFGGLEAFPLGRRLANAVIAYGTYVGKMLWPTKLAVPYPLIPGAQTPGRVLASAVLLVAISVLAIRGLKRRPYLAVGWLWYLVTLLPVIGLFQVGIQSMADRYTYVPLVGLFVMVAWGVPDLLRGTGLAPAARPAILGGAAGLAVLALTGCAYVQAGRWRNTSELFAHVLRVTEQNATAHNALGLDLYESGRPDDAIAHYREAIRIAPGFDLAYANLGAALSRIGKTDEAIAAYRQAFRLRLESPGMRTTVAGLLMTQGRDDEAAAEITRAMGDAPGDVSLRKALGSILARQGKSPEAMAEFEAVLRETPEDAEALASLGTLLMKQGDLAGASARFAEALSVEPDNVPAHKNLGVILARQGRYGEAVAQFTEALRVRPEDDGVRRNLEHAKALAAGGR